MHTCACVALKRVNKTSVNVGNKLISVSSAFNFYTSVRDWIMRVLSYFKKLSNALKNRLKAFF